MSSVETSCSTTSVVPCPFAFVAHKNGVRWDDFYGNLEWTRFLYTWFEGEQPCHYDNGPSLGASGRVGLDVDISSLPFQRLILLAGEALASLEVTAALANYRVAHSPEADRSRIETACMVAADDFNFCWNELSTARLKYIPTLSDDGLLILFEIGVHREMDFLRNDCSGQVMDRSSAFNETVKELFERIIVQEGFSGPESEPYVIKVIQNRSRSGEPGLRHSSLPIKWEPYDPTTPEEEVIGENSTNETMYSESNTDSAGLRIVDDQRPYQVAPIYYEFLGQN